MAYEKRDLFEEKIREIKNRFLKIFPPRLQPFVVVFIVCFFFLFPKVGEMKSFLVANRAPDKIIGSDNNVIKIDGDNNEVNVSSGKDKTSESLESREFSCSTNGKWIPFTSEYWDHLTLFLQIGEVFTLPSQNQNVDTVAYYKNSCRGGFTAEVKFIPESESLINLDLFYGSWFRWEIGGNDLRSAKLYKNLEGCSAMKRVVPVRTIKQYLEDHEEILPGKPVIATFSAYLTDTGKLRTDLGLQFFSKRTKKQITEDGFFCEFEVDLKCDKNKVLNIENDYERIGVGLMRSATSSAELPKAVLQEFRISPK